MGKVGAERADSVLATSFAGWERSFCLPLSWWVWLFLVTANYYWLLRFSLLSLMLDRSKWFPLRLSLLDSVREISGNLRG